MIQRLTTHKYNNMKISEMLDTEKDTRYFYATIEGWNNFRFYSKNEYEKSQVLFEKVLIKVNEIKEIIKNSKFIGKEIKSVGELKNAYYL